MADLYGTTAPTSGHEPEEISAFLNQLIHNSSSSSSCLCFNAKYINHSLSPPPPPPDAKSDSAALISQPEDRHHRSADPPSAVPDSSPGGFNFSNSLATCVTAVDSDTYDSEKGPEASEAPSNNNTVRPKPPSKRSRAAEVHNMSEKRRRSRINEKMKALQNLIPNSNKTDKASMLDEAIEYLKQLQLQVQMLTMRNGLSLHPMWLPGALQPVQLPQTGMVFDEENGLLNTNRGTGTFSANEEGSIQTAFNICDQSTISNQPIAISSAANITTSSETSFGLEPLIQAHYGPFGLSSSSKDIGDGGAPQLHLDMNFTGKDSSSGMS